MGIVLKWRRGFFRSALIGMLAVSTGQASAIIIDDFSQGAVVLTDPLGFGPSPDDLQTGLNPGNTVGGARRISFNAIDPSPVGDTGSVKVEVNTANGGALIHTPDPGLTAANFDVSYGDLAGQASLGLDLTAGGGDRFVFDFAFTTGFVTPAVSTVAFDFIVNTDGGSVYKFVVFQDSATPASIEVTFDDLETITPAIDLTHVNGIRFGTANGTLEGAFQLDAIRVIPEPASGVLGLVFVVAGLNRRRRGAIRA